MFYSSLVCLYVYACAFKSKVHCGSDLGPGTSGLPYYCAPLVFVCVVLAGLAVWRHNKPQTQKPVRWGRSYELRRYPLPIAATESGASRLVQRALMMLFGLCMCRATRCQIRATADGAPLVHITSRTYRIPRVKYRANMCIHLSR